MNWWTYMVVVFVLITYLFTRVSSTFKFYVKYTSFLYLCILLPSVMGLFCIFRPGSSYNLFIAKLFLKLLNFEWWLGYNIKIKDTKNLLNCQKPFVAVSNHQSAIDACIVIKASPNGTAPLAKKILLYVPIFGQVSWLCGTIFINRTKGKSSIEIMRKVGEEMREKITSLWIFSEGTRHQLDTVMPFKKGAFHLAIQAQVPIVPITISNYRNVIDCKNKLFNGGEIRVYCHPPVLTEGLTANDVDHLMETVHKIILNKFQTDQKENASVYKDLIPLKTE